MSDVAQGPAWWQASDGKWYPPELHPSYLPPPPTRPSYMHSPVVGRPAVPTRRTLSRSQWTQAAALVFGLIGLLMSWGTVFIVSVSGIDTGDGKLFGVGLLMAVACLFWRVSSESAVGGLLLILTWVALVALGIYEVGHISSSHIVSVGSGLYIDTAASIIGAIASVVDLLSSSKKTATRMS